MLHGPEYRSGRDPDLDAYRARHRFGHHKGDQAVKAPRKKTLTPLILLAFVAVTALVMVRNPTALAFLMGVKSVTLATGCAVAHDLGRPRSGDRGLWADGRFTERGPCEEEAR